MNKEDFVVAGDPDTEKKVLPLPFQAISQYINASTILKSQCPDCGATALKNAHLLDIPDFKDLVLSFIDCPTCGNVSKDISTGEEISQKGRRTTLQVKNLNDMVRELIKSNTCTVIVPELDLELTPGTLGIQFSTVQALFNAVWEDLSRNVMQIQNASDGSNPLADFIKRLEECVYCEREFTFIIDDPLSNSYIQRYENETQIHVELYDRTEQVADR